MAIDLSQFQDVFYEESIQQLADMTALLRQFDLAAPPASQIDKVDSMFSVAHSVNGNAAIFGFEDMVTVVGQAEALLDGVRKGDVQLNEEMRNALLHAGLVLQTLLTAHLGKGAARVVDKDDVIRVNAHLKQLVGLINRK